MPKKSTPTKEADDVDVAARDARIAELQDKLKRQEQELAALRPRDGVISTPAMGLNNPWHNTSLLNLPPVPSQAAPMDPARTLDLEEKKADTADTLLQVKKALAAKKAKDFIISPKIAEGTSDFIKILRRDTKDGDFDHPGYVQTLLSVLS